MILLPEDPDRSAHRIRARLRRRLGIDLPVIISDTFGRPWRRGLTDVAIGVSGLEAVVDLKGTRDWVGRELEVTEIAVADELASAADLVMGKAEGIPAALIRGYRGPRGEGRGQDLVRPPEEDLFR
jgi:coenzyme F420-0:L-glutamate ligase/coenzyme F420-1:gamma-L-glutamate ligase